MAMPDDDFIGSLRIKLEANPICASVTTVDELRLSMQHQACSVWDLTPQIRCRQSEVAPAPRSPTSRGDASTQGFINEPVLQALLRLQAEAA